MKTNRSHILLSIIFVATTSVSAQTVTLSKKLTSNDGTPQDHCGWAVSASGDVAVVGAPDDDQGSAYVFERNEGGNDNWGLVKKLTASDGEALDDFGYSEAVSGDIIVVGAPADDVGANGNQGSAYVFARNQGGANNWGQVKKLVASDGVGGDQLGYAVSVSGNVVVIGAPVDNVGLNADQGSAYLFERNQGGTNNWGQVKRLTAADGAAGDQLGFSVAVSGDVVVAGAVVDNSGQGSAYLFARNQGGANNWGQVKRVSASDAAADDWFGYSVAVSGDAVLVGAPQEFSGPGAAYLFARHQDGDNNWGQTQKLTASDGVVFDAFGLSVSLSDGVALVGAVFDDVGSNQDQGSAYVFFLPVIHLLSPAWVNGEFQVTLSGTTGLDCSLLMSSNLVDWASVTNVTLSDIPQLITVPADSDRGFFRAVSPPVP